MAVIREGDSFCFGVLKKISVSEPSDNFVLSGPGGRKFLLPVMPYSHYNISEGQVINCMVHRINCNGKVFLEPESPYYKSGETYIFPVKDTGSRLNWSGEDIPVLIIEDLFGIKYPVSANPGKYTAKAKEISLVVKDILKGRLVFENTKHRGNNKRKYGRREILRVKKLSVGLDDREYFVAEDQTGKHYLVPKDYYGYYGIVPGQSFSGKIYEERGLGLFAEPDNPYYKEGMIIDVDIESIAADPVNNTFTIKLKDSFGFIHKTDSLTLLSSGSVKAVVKKIRKGKPVLKIL